MRIWFNKNFGLSKSEFNGLLILLFVIIMLKVIPIIYSSTIITQSDAPELLAQIKKLEITNEQNLQYNRDRIEYTNVKRAISLSKFDPNKLDGAGWERLGLSPKQAQAIVNYTNKGGKFFKPEDLQKMYTISPEMYKMLLPYISIDQDENSFPLKTVTYEKKEYVKKAAVMVDINKADSAELDKISGIGGAFANRILKYRERLGGFHKTEQLMEVYGLDTAKYNEIKSQITLTSVPLKIVNINTAAFNDLKTNPYLSYKQINAIIQYRKQHGNYASPNDLNKVLILNQLIIDRITPYISF